MTVGQILESDEETLLRLRLFGRGCYEELRDRLHNMRLLHRDARLGESGPEEQTD
jgi:hypothetical protein